MKYLFIAICCLFMTACSSSSSKDVDEGKSNNSTLNTYVSEDTEFAKPNDAGGYGEEFEVRAELCDLSTLQAGSNNCMVQGKVSEVCAKKGCWMSMNVEGEDLFVHFKDYGFFVPRDITDRDIILRGKSYYDTTSIDDLRHFAEDAGKSEEEIELINEPKVELKFEATGAIVL